MLPRRQAEGAPPRKRRTPEEKASQRRQIFCPPFSTGATPDMKDKVYPVWRECDEGALATFAVAPRSALWWRYAFDRSSHTSQYVDCGQQVFDGSHSCANHTNICFRNDRKEHQGAGDCPFTLEERRMLDLHQRRTCKHLQGPGEVDQVHGWATVTIKGQLYFTFCKEAGAIFRRGLQQWLFKRVKVVSSLVHQYVKWRLARSRPFPELDGHLLLLSRGRGRSRMVARRDTESV